MHGLELAEGPLTLLLIGAHPDDFELGAGATVARLLQRTHPVTCVALVMSGPDRRASEAAASAEKLLAEATDVSIEVHEFTDSHFPSQLDRIKHALAETAARIEPDVVFTHTRDDVHQDHRVVAELTWNHFRDHMILEYSVPQYEQALGDANVYVQLSRPEAEAKVEHVMSSFPSQLTKPWFSAETLMAVMRLRGVECRAPDGYAEAFLARRVALSI